MRFFFFLFLLFASLKKQKKILPYFFLMIDLRLWYTSQPMRIASENDDAPTGRIINSCIARALPAWLPPLMMLNEGTGSTSLGFPARSAM